MSVSRVPSINLAKRPFRNNTVHYIVFGSCFVLLAAASVYNVYDFVVTGGEIGRFEQDLGERTSRYRGLSDEVEQMKSNVSKLDLTTLNAKSNFANGLIMSRLFSWSVLFDRIEELIPPDVKIRSIRPAISPKGIEIQIDGMARTPTALYDFETALAGSSFFTSVYPTSESTRESKTELNFDLMMNYIPAGRNNTEPGTPATPTAGLPLPEQAAAATPPGEAGAAAGTAEAAPGNIAPSPETNVAAAAGAPPGPDAPVNSPAAAATPQPQNSAGAGNTGQPEAAGAAPVAPAPRPAQDKPVPELTNKEFIEKFGKERFIKARGKFIVAAPLEHPEMDNATFIQKFGMEQFLKARGHLNRAGHVMPGAGTGAATPTNADPNQEAPQ